MCGLVGLAGKLEHKDEVVMKRLLIFDTVRGLDATGLAAVRSKKYEVAIAKAPSNPFELFETRRFKSALSAWESSVFIGHNRAATTGAKTALNAHPFEFGDVVGAHNGTLTTKSWKELEDKLGEEFDVDSQALYAAIAKFGLKETITMTEKGTTSQNGAWALTYYDGKDDSLNLIRNDHRPLWVCYTKEMNKIFWASEWPMLHAALAMSGRLDELYRDKEGRSFFSLPVDTWYRADISELMAGGTECPLKAVGEVKGKEVTYSYQPPFMGSTRGTTTSTTSNIATHPSTNRQVACFSFRADKEDPFADILTDGELTQAVMHGCAWCGEPLQGNEVGSTYLELVHGIIGPCCTKQTQVTRAVLKSDTFQTLQELTQ